ncbi:transporter substrate-binding domain-containing protein, partial [Citrobacter sp. TBCS-11]
GATKPFTYSDSQGNLTGYDIEVARAVFKKLPQYTVKFQATDFSGIAPGIDSGRSRPLGVSMKTPAVWP